MIGKGHPNELGAVLKRARQAKALSLSAVASPAKISAAYIQKLEGGTVKNPSPRVLHRVAGVLDVSYSRLMELAGYVFPEQDDPAAKDTATGGMGAPGDDLTAEERRAVAVFISYLKAQRGKA